LKFILSSLSLNYFPITALRPAAFIASGLQTSQTKAIAVAIFYQDYLANNFIYLQDFRSTAARIVKDSLGTFYMVARKNFEILP